MEPCHRKLGLLQRGSVLQAICSIAVPMAVVMVVSALFTVGMIVLNFIFQAIGRPERALPFLILAILVVQVGGSLILHVGLIDYIGYLVLISVGAVVSFALALNYLLNVDELNPNRDPFK